MTDQTDQNKHWYKISVAIAAPAAEAVEFAFNSVDSLGTETSLNKEQGLISVAGFFNEPPDEATLDRELAYALGVYGLTSDAIQEVVREQVEDQDWLAEWKKGWLPSVVGSFVIAPPWSGVKDPRKTVVQIEPNMAFGTGTHETTQLCLSAIDRLYRPEMSLLDVGTGTGILAIAAAKAFEMPGRIVALDTDPDAVAIAATNAEMNGVAGRIEFLTGTAGNAAGEFDLVCANLTADVIVPILPTLIAKSGSFLVLSGILAEQEILIQDSLPGELRREVFRAGEWIAVTVSNVRGGSR